MAVPTLERALQRLRSKAEEDEAFAEAVRFLAADVVEDPWERPEPPVLEAARTVNRSREEQRRVDFARRALDTADVVELIGSISDRKAVDRRRRRGGLLGLRIGNRTLHPDWQFDRRRGETRAALGRLLEALREVTDDVLIADALMTTPRDDLDGRPIADVFAEGHVDLAIRLVRMAGDAS